MVQFISDIIARFGGRTAGSEEETQAQAVVSDLLKQHTSQVETQPFRAALNAKFEALKIIFGMYYIALALGPFFPGTGFIISATALVLFLGNFLLNLGWLDFMFPKSESRNVVGTLEPQGEVKNTLYISGHIDSVKEFQWWYHLKTFGIRMNIASVLLLLVLPLCYLALILSSGLHRTPFEFSDYFPYVYWFIVALSPFTLSFFFMRSKRKVDGASDNLSGIAVSLEVFKSLAAGKGTSTLKHTRIRMISFGSEETGLKGSKAFVAQNEQRLHSERSMIINIDTIKEPEHLSIVTRETNTLTRFDPSIVSGLELAFSQKNIYIKKIALNIGGTDAVPFQKDGIPAVTIIGMNSSELDESYHTRLDTLDRMNPYGMEYLHDGLLHYITSLDASLSN